MLAVSRFGAGDLAGFTELLKEDFVSPNPRVTHDPAARSGRQAFADYLFRVDGDLIVEHWDVVQPI
jgi:predicted SnoaL-like aldol condensation-catalyzing enzyme